MKYTENKHSGEYKNAKRYNWGKDTMSRGGGQKQARLQQTCRYLFLSGPLQVFIHTIQCNSQCTHAAPAERLLCIHPQRNYSAYFVTAYRTHFHQLRSSNRKANQFVSLMLTKLQLEFTLLYNILPCRYTDKCIELMMRGGEGAFSVLYRFKV